MSFSRPSRTGEHPVVVAIDGPAASGKSSVARRIAAALDFHHVNTGAMYRGAAWLALEKGIDLEDQHAVGAALAEADFRYEMTSDGGSKIVIDGIEVGDALKSDEVNAAVSVVASIPEVRGILVDLQRHLAARGSLVMEGRDIGSVVFPDTPHKFYVDANPEVRARRRSAEGSQESIAKRDEMDSTRKASPLVVAEDAQRIDTSYLTIDEVVVEVLGRLRAKGVHPPKSSEGKQGRAYRNGIHFFSALARSFYDYRVIGQHNVPARGPMLLVCNHVSFLDPPMIGLGFPGEVHYVARKTLFRHPFFKWLYTQWRAIPLDQEKPELSAMREIIARIRSGHRVLVFPEGKRSPDGQLLEGQQGAGFLAAKSDAPILPMRLFGPEKIMPLGKKLPRPGTITLVVGEPFSISKEDREAMGSGKDLYKAIANLMMEKIAALHPTP